MTSPRDALPTAISNGPFFQSASRQRVLLIFGTRPEAIKLCPLIAALRSEPACSDIEVSVCVTAQHRQMLDQVLSAFEVKPDYDLDLMQPGQSLPALTARLFSALEPVFSDARPNLTIVQGDTTTTFCGAVSSFYAGVPVAHVEAGLRTFDMRAPFPEEMNGVLVAPITDLHFAATPWAAENLLNEGVSPEKIEVTGNTGIDAVLYVRDAIHDGRLPGLDIMKSVESKKLIVVTAHRRESFGPGFDRICNAVSRLADRDDVQIAWPVHPNPNVRGIVNGTLGGKPNVSLFDPFDYVPFVDLMRRAYLLITDSGGVQEEGPSLGKPILVLRDKTERPEAVEAGTVKLVGTDENAIVREAERLLEDSAEFERMSRLHNPYGDGKASVRIARRIAAYLAAKSAPATASIGI